MPAISNAGRPTRRPISAVATGGDVHVEAGGGVAPQQAGECPADHEHWADVDPDQQ